jgi:Uncharacterized protein conserved in bacteria (DUF2330)
MSTPARFLAMLVVLLGMSRAMADGGAFKRLIEDPKAATMPDQAAVIAFDQGVETLAIQTRFEGNASEFAWVVPLPSVPEVSACQPGVFRVLPALFPRRVITDRNIPPLWFVSLWLVATMIVGLRCKAWWSRILVTLMMLVAFVIVFAPAMGKARESAGSPREGSLQVSSEMVGDFEVTTLSSGKADEVISWLASHEFSVTDAARAAITSYATEGWCFVASRANRSPQPSADGTITPHPLIYRFKTATPVYPMRLTGANNTGPLSVTLYVFGPGTASIPGWHLRRSAACELIEPTEGEWPSRFPSPSIRVSYEPLRALLPKGVAQGTCLMRTLQPFEMREDVRVGFLPCETRQEEIYTSQAVVAYGLNLAGGAFLVLSIVAMMLKALSPTRRLTPLLAAGFAASSLIGGLYAAMLPSGVALTRPKFHEAYLPMELERLDPAITSLADLRFEVRRIINDNQWEIQEFDGPGGYTLEESDHAFTCRYVDDFGQELRWTKDKKS